MAAGGGEQASPVGVESVRALLTDLRASISQDIMKETLFVGFIHCALACFIVHEKHEADPQREPPLSDYFQPGKGFNPFSVRTAYERYVPMGALLAELSFAEPPIGRLPSSHVEASALLQIDPRNRVEVWRKAVESNPSAKVITSKCLAGGVERNPWAKQHKDCHIDDEELDQFVRFLMFSEAFQQLSPQARDELGITSTRLSCYDRGCNQFEVALRLRVQELLENQEREEAFFLVIFVTVFSSYEYLKGKFLKNLVGNEKDPAPFFWPRREHWPQIEEHLLLMVKVEDATEGSVVLTEWFGMSPAYYGFGQAVDAERRHLLEALLAGKNSFNTALERTTAHGLFGDAKILAMEDLMDVETGQGVQDFLEWLTTPNSHQRLGKKPKPLGWGALWGNVVTARLVNTGLFPECDFVPALSSGSEKTLKAIFPRATGKGVRLVYPTLAVQAATRLRDLGWEGLGFLPAEVKKLPMSVLEHALCKAQSKGPTVGAAPHSWQDCLKSAFPEETELALVSSLLERTEPMDIAPSLAQECVQAFWDVVKADQAIEGAIGVVGKRCIELMERKCNMAKLLHLGVNTLNTAEGKTFWASLHECADFTDKKAVRALRKEEFESTVAKNVLSSVLGAKDSRFTASEKHSDLVWLHLVEAIEKHFVNESEAFADLFRLTDITLECPEDANDLLFVTLEHLIKPGSDARAWLDSSGREFPNDGKRALLEISRRLDDQTEPLDALQLLIEIRFEANVDPDARIRRFNELVADASHQLGVPLKPGVGKKHFLSALDNDFFSAEYIAYRKGKGKFYRVGAKNNVESAFHVATETFVPKCMLAECAGCFHGASECPTLSMNLYSADDDTVRRSYLAEFVTAEMQAAYDDEDDDAFCDICDAYGKAEVHKGPSANTFPSTAATAREPSLPHSFVAKDATVTAAPPVVNDEEKPQFIVDKKVAFRTASVVHSDLWRDWESPVVMDMTPTQDCGHFDSFTDIAENAIGEPVDDADVYEDALPEEPYVFTEVQYSI
ncbi:hypothetical protein CYMTET_4506 [Cymbomonas tetramitiformis]|uniref:Uncharacterized protein n=1 Tax=Cymbomonas tetramitiformis TaxID=36881 RepID=A0AAE0H1B3_9CHLO|nr:hypothetical protein CYMTET_4506 [Cymbomonas tetramitiformis]